MEILTRAHSTRSISQALTSLLFLTALKNTKIMPISTANPYTNHLPLLSHEIDKTQPSARTHTSPPTHILSLHYMPSTGRNKPAPRQSFSSLAEILSGKTEFFICRKLDALAAHMHTTFTQSVEGLESYALLHFQIVSSSSPCCGKITTEIRIRCLLFLSLLARCSYV